MFKLLKSTPASFLFRSVFRFSSSKQQQQLKLASLITDKIKNSQVKVQDISEGTSCGVIYNIFVESESFTGKSLVEQHQMITNAIKGELKSIHAINIRTKTKTPDSNSNSSNTNNTKEGTKDQKKEDKKDEKKHK